jgi:hypothetical protein
MLAKGPFPTKLPREDPRGGGPTRLTQRRHCRWETVNSPGSGGAGVGEAGFGGKWLTAGRAAGGGSHPSLINEEAKQLALAR